MLKLSKRDRPSFSFERRVLSRSDFLVFSTILLSLCYAAGETKADYVYLNDGSIISGVLIEEKPKLLIYRVPHGEIKPGDVLVDIQQTKLAGLSVKKAYDLFLLLNKFNFTTQRPVVLKREKILWQGTKEYVGLGISLEKVDRGIKVTNLMPNGPAARAGVLKDDLIIKLEGRDISSSSMDEIIKIIKGEAGTGLKAVIERQLTLK